MKHHIYQLELENFLLSPNRLYIPRLIKQNESLKLYKRYWCTFSNSYFKVDSIDIIDNIEYYSVKYLNFLFGTISYPVSSKYTYELMMDKNDISNLDNIVNINKSYSGAEIKFWFFINNIDLKKYFGFWGFIDSNSKCCINDNKYYFVEADIKNDIYINCKMVVDKSR